MFYPDRKQMAEQVAMCDAREIAFYVDNVEELVYTLLLSRIEGTKKLSEDELRVEWATRFASATK